MLVQHCFVDAVKHSVNILRRWRNSVVNIANFQFCDGDMITCHSAVIQPGNASCKYYCKGLIYQIPVYPNTLLDQYPRQWDRLSRSGLSVSTWDDSLRWASSDDLRWSERVHNQCVRWWDSSDQPARMHFPVWSGKCFAWLVMLELVWTDDHNKQACTKP